MPRADPVIKILSAFDIRKSTFSRGAALQRRRLSPEIRRSRPGVHAPDCRICEEGPTDPGFSLETEQVKLRAALGILYVSG